MEFFTQNTLRVSNVPDIYINSVVNRHQQIEKAADKFFKAQKVPTTLIIKALEHQNAKLFFKNLTKHGNEDTCGLILRYSRWEYVNTQLLQNCPKILGILSKCKDFPSERYLVKFLQDLQKEITEETDCSATKKAILILTSAKAWSLEACCKIIKASKSPILKAGEKELLESVLVDHVFSSPMKSARNVANVAYEELKQSSNVGGGGDPEIHQDPSLDPERSHLSPSTSLHNFLLDRIVQVVFTTLSKMLSIIPIKYLHGQHNNLDQDLSVQCVDEGKDLLNNSHITAFTPPSPLSMINSCVSNTEISFPEPNDNNSTLLLQGAGAGVAKE